MQGDHAADRRAQRKLLGVAFLAGQRDLLTIALQFEDADFSRFGYIVEMIRALETCDVFLRVFELNRILFLIDFAQNRTLADLDLRLFEVRLRLLQVGRPLFSVALMLGPLLIDLMAEVIVFGLRFAGELQFVSTVEFGQQIPRVHGGAVLNQAGQR